MSGTALLPPEVSPVWLTEVLRAHGQLRAGSVAAVALAETIETPPSLLQRLTASYTPDAQGELPPQLVLKIARPHKSAAGRKEVAFYTAILPSTPTLPVVRCHAAHYDEAGGASFLLLADVSATHRPALWPLPPTRPEAELIVDALARLHAAWWDHPRLGRDVGLPLEEDRLRQSYHEYATTMFQEFANLLGDRLSAARRSLYERVLARLPALVIRRACAGRALTLCHGDSHTGNFLVPHDVARGQVYIIDWQGYRHWWGARDLAYMITPWWYPERRQWLEQPLLRRYHERLLEAGIVGYSWEECWADYRLAAIDNLLAPVLNRHYPRIMWPQLENTVNAFHDLGCDELLA